MCCLSTKLLLLEVNCRLEARNIQLLKISRIFNASNYTVHIAIVYLSISDWVDNVFMGQMRIRFCCDCCWIPRASFQYESNWGGAANTYYYITSFFKSPTSHHTLNSLWYWEIGYSNRWIKYLLNPIALKINFTIYTTIGSYIFCKLIIKFRPSDVHRCIHPLSQRVENLWHSSNVYSVCICLP